MPADTANSTIHFGLDRPGSYMEAMKLDERSEE